MKIIKAELQAVEQSRPDLDGLNRKINLVVDKMDTESVSKSRSIQKLQSAISKD